jgi:dihydropyrimidinase
MGLGNTSELLLPVLLSEGVNKGRISLEQVARICALNPAQVFGLYPRKGRLEEGADADIVIIDLEKRATVSPESLHSMCDWTIYDGWELKGWPTHTILHGKLIVENGEPLPINPAGQGQYIPRHAA